MRASPDGRMRHLQSLASKALEAGNAGDHLAARQTLEQLQQRLDALGLRSGWAHWALAEALLAALSLTTPASRDVWAERARLARQQGDLARAALFDAEGEARCTPDVPFSIPSAHEA